MKPWAAQPAMAALIVNRPVAGLRRDDYITLSRFRQNQGRQAILALGLKADDLIGRALHAESSRPQGITPEQPFAAHEVMGLRIPLGVAWPPTRRVPLTRRETELKLRAIRAHSSHLEGATDPHMTAERKYLESFVKAEEVFWVVKR